MPFINGGGGGGGGVTPPVTITGTNPASAPLTVVGAAGQSASIISVESEDGTAGLTINGDGANGIGNVGLSGPNFGSVVLAAGQESSISADTNIVFFSGSATGAFALSAFNAAPADAALAAGDMALWFDKTNGAAKLMVKAKQANGTVVAASIALA